MRIIILFLLGTGFVFAQVMDPFLMQHRSGLLRKSAPEDLHLLVSGKSDIANELRSAGFDVQCDLGSQATVIAPSDRLDELTAIHGISRIFMGPKMRLHNGQAINYQRAAVAHNKAYTGSGVIIGIVDTGIDFYHRMFRKQDGATRILYIWDQTMTGSGPAGTTFKYGKEYTSTQINQDIASGKPYSIVKQRDTEGHGTHVAGSAAGRDLTISPADTLHGGAMSSNLIIVKTTLQSVQIIDAVKYIFDKAFALGKPCVINLSLGSQAGPHDGADDSTTPIDDLTGAGKIVVRSAGNNGGDQIHYYSATVVSSEQIKFGYVNYLDVWIESGDNLQSVSLAWSKASITNVTMGSSKSSSNITLYLIKASDNPNNKIRAFVQMDNSALKSDTFTLTLNTLSDGNSSGTIKRHVWADTSALQNPSGAFSQGTKYGASFYPYTLGNEACGKNVITVGAFITRESWTAVNNASGQQWHYPNSGDDGGIATFSSIGPTADERPKPDIVAGGMIILSARSSEASYSESFLPPAPYTNNYAYLQGTSMASPVAAGAIALLLEKNPAWTPQDVMNYLIMNARGTSSPDGWSASELKVKYNPNTWDSVFGYGAIDLTNEFKNAPPNEKTEDEVVSGYELRQNYPNPFNPKTIIKYKIDSAATVRITLFDAAGRKIGTLLNEWKSSGEVHFLEVNAAGLASGVYFYRLETNHFTQTRKMIVLR